MTRPRRPPKPAGAVAEQHPVARVAVDTGLAHLDRPFDYAVPAAVADDVQPGVRVRVRFAGRLVDGIVLERADASDHQLSQLHALVSPEPVLSPEIAALARAVADRSAGTLYDVLRLALPPRHARVEAEPALPPDPLPPAPEPGSWDRYRNGPSYLSAIFAGRGPRAVWSALPGPTWPDELAMAVRACAASGRGAVVVVPDARDLARVSAALGDLPHAALSADLGPAERYRRWLRVRRGQVRVAVGTRATAFAPVADLGLVVLWDDGDDLHAEPRSPYVHVRDVLVLRAHLTGAAALLGGHARTAEGQLLVDSGWARSLQASREQVRAVAPRVEGVSDDDLARDPLARAARLPAKAFEAARHALADGAPVLVQVPRRGFAPSLACAADRTPARCAACNGPLATGRHATACRWCGRLAGDWRCPVCAGRELRATVIGARRTAEELGRAFPGTVVRTSGREEVLPTVPEAPALVVATPGAEPVATGGYGAVLLLDGWAMLGRADLRAGEEALRRWFAAAALARPDGQVVVAADRGLVPVQALSRWDPAGAAARELADRTEVGFPPATRMASIEGPPHGVAEFARELPAELEVLGPVPGKDGAERLLLRVPRPRGLDLASALKAAQAVRSARKGEPVRVELDPQLLT
ncbi:MAG: primosomal protein N' [Actinobacteria bacterium]|nr:primosomal protein N' [Actinomycetota bacterium]MCA1720721.1 primosomal protein N' [Actinomycetota bacterium]